MVMGRPPIKLSDFQEGWKEKMLALAAEGASDVELRAEVLGCIAHETWTRLLTESPDFLETVKQCRLLCQLWWEKQGRTGLYADKFNATTWIFNMKNRFKDDWKDRTEQNHGVTGEFEKLVRELENLP